MVSSILRITGLGREWRFMNHHRVLNRTAWNGPTFADTLAAVRRAIWNEQGFVGSRQSGDAAKLPPALREGIAYALCHAA
jgi:hypothetical protein